MTIIPFMPSSTGAFHFQAELDAVIYNCIVTWNTFGQRWYLNVYSQDGTLIVARAMISSPLTYDISLVAGYFVSTLIYRGAKQQFEISP